MPDYQNAIDVEMNPYTDYLRKVYKRFPDVMIDPTPDLFVWRVWLESTFKILGTIDISWIAGTNVDQAKAKLCQQIDNLFRHYEIIP